jgi:thiamine transporter
LNVSEIYLTGVFTMAIQTKSRHELLLRLVTSAILIALAAVLSNVQFIRMPLGGSVTLLSMLPVCLLSLKYGVKWGLVCGFLYGITQVLFGLNDLMTWGMTPATWVGCLAFDYILPFTALGLAGIFGNDTMPRIIGGISLALVLRFICHFISGAIVFAIWAPEGWNVYFYSLVYNGAYMGPELILTLAGAVALFKIPATKKLLLA